MHLTTLWIKGAGIGPATLFFHKVFGAIVAGKLARRTFPHTTKWIYAVTAGNGPGQLWKMAVDEVGANHFLGPFLRLPAAVAPNFLFEPSYILGYLTGLLLEGAVNWALDWVDRAGDATGLF